MNHFLTFEQTIRDKDPSGEFHAYFIGQSGRFHWRHHAKYRKLSDDTRKRERKGKENTKCNMLQRRKTPFPKFGEKTKRPLCSWLRAGK
ncbi:hypothetical protein WN51_12053 [Melipona quadrifasciata]|uniref:Uncharacterized protein n=1 Tax=Melipona quadrifasciata TaxID=166423 RepID=A0A0M9A3J9_9HYME|nr:hypothetical protein WN51_12053 [Melipona quadrifasciata]